MTTMLLVSHEASLTGAPRVAVDILRAATGYVDERVALLRWPGPLETDFALAADRVRMEPGRRLRVSLRRFRRTRRIAVKVEEAAASLVLWREKPDLVYLNTVLSACYVRPALRMGCAVVLHSHEMDDLATGTLARYDLEAHYGKMRLVACSAAAASQLQAIAGVGEVEVVHSVVDVSRVQRLALAPTHVPVSAPLVMACGTGDVRKGVDLWLKAAEQIQSRLGSESPSFLWVGDDSEGRNEHFARESGLGESVRFAGPLPNPYPLMAAADVITVPSRQDASPLVVFEAMALGKPVVAFDVGGIAEQLGDAGLLVAPGDVDGMADAVVALLADEGSRRRLGSAGRMRLQEKFGYDRFSQQLQSLIAEEMASRSGASKGR